MKVKTKPPPLLRNEDKKKSPVVTRRSFPFPITFLLLLFLVWLSATALQCASAFECPGSRTPPLVIRGKRFYDSSSDEYFPIKGIAYYPRPNSGPLAHGSSSVDFYTDEYSQRWRADISNMKELGINAVRIYAVDPSKNHDAFMCALSEAGIYVMLGLLADCEGCAIGAWVGVDAEPPMCYPSSVKERGRFVVRSFSKYPNLMAFSAGNEVTIYADDGSGGPREANISCQKKFLRDMREYVSGCAGSYPNAVLPRAIPIGVVNWDGNTGTFSQNVYYQCRTDRGDPFENAEWFALNSYRHCDGLANTPDEIIGWPDLRETFREANFPGPVFFGEYGCRERGFPTLDGFDTQRTWLQTEALYDPDYSDVFAGGFVFEYSAEKTTIDGNLQFWADKLDLDEPESEWPYKKFARANYGIGYFGPSDCQHDDGGDSDNSDNSSNCEYTRYPEWDRLAEALATSEGQGIRPQSAGVLPECPTRYQALADFDWPTDREEDPDLDYCLELQRNAASTDSPTDSPTGGGNGAAPETDEPTGAFAFRTDTPSAFPTPAVSFEFRTQFPTQLPSESRSGEGTQQPTESLSEEATQQQTQSARCSDHDRCASANLSGFCCPTSDGVVLGCCDVVSEAPSAAGLAFEFADGSGARTPPLAVAVLLAMGTSFAAIITII